MKNLTFALVILSATNILAAEDSYESSILKETIKKELGSCYEKIVDSVSSCQEYTCSMPNFEKINEWIAVKIIGTYKNGNCYIIKYNFQDDKVIGDPWHCFYDNNNLRIYSNYWNVMKTNTSLISFRENQNRIKEFEKNFCKIDDEKSN